MKSLQQSIYRTVDEIIESKKGTERGFNLTDFMLNHNDKHKDNPDEIIGKEDIAGNYFVFQSAGTDTTQYSTQNSLNFLCSEPEVQETLRKGISESILPQILASDPNSVKKWSFGEVTSCEILIDFLYEQLRFTDMMPFSTIRECTNDVKLGNYIQKRGDQVIMAPDANNETHFSEVNKFKIDRFKDWAKKPHGDQMRFTPFSFGKRGCLGRNFAQMSFSIMMSKFQTNFKLEKGSEWSNAFTIREMLMYKKYSVKLTRIKE